MTTVLLWCSRCLEHIVYGHQCSGPLCPVRVDKEAA